LDTKETEKVSANNGFIEAKSIAGYFDVRRVVCNMGLTRDFLGA